MSLKHFTIRGSFRNRTDNPGLNELKLKFSRNGLLRRLAAKGNNSKNWNMGPKLTC